MSKGERYSMRKWSANEQTEAICQEEFQLRMGEIAHCRIFPCLCFWSRNKGDPAKRIPYKSCFAQLEEGGFLFSVAHAGIHRPSYVFHIFSWEPINIRINRFVLTYAWPGEL